MNKSKPTKQEFKVPGEMNAWIIGASTGIGEALCKQLAVKTRRLFASARSAERLQQLGTKGRGNIVPIAMDVTMPEQVLAAAETIEQTIDQVDLVIINAGTCEYIDSNNIDTASIRHVMETNFFGATNVVKVVLPMLRKARTKDSSRKPMLVFVSSSVTYQALPRAGAYGASKAAMRYFAECLRLDLQHEGIDVRVVSPGFVDTPLTQKNDFPMPFSISAEQAAQRIVRGIEGRRFDIRFPFPFISILKLLSVLPDRIRFYLVGKMSRHTEPDGEPSLQVGKRS